VVRSTLLMFSLSCYVIWPLGSILAFGQAFYLPLLAWTSLQEVPFPDYQVNLARDCISYLRVQPETRSGKWYIIYILSIPPSTPIKKSPLVVLEYPLLHQQNSGLCAHVVPYLWIRNHHPNNKQYSSPPRIFNTLPSQLTNCPS
jgi:hypothetical protein